MKLKSLITTILSSFSLSLLFGCAKPTPTPTIHEEHKLVYKGYRTIISEEAIISSEQATSIEIKPKNKRYEIDFEHSYAPQINYIDKDKKTIGGASFVYNEDSITITFDKIQTGIYAEGDFELSLLNESQIFPETDYEKHEIDYVDETEITELVSQPQPINPYEESTGFVQTKGSYRFLNGTKSEDVEFTYVDSNNTPIIERPTITSVDRRNIHLSFPTIPEGKYGSGNFKLTISNVGDLVEYTGKHELIYKDEHSQLAEPTYLSIDTPTKAVVRGKEGYILNGDVTENNLNVLIKSQKGKPDPTFDVIVVNRKINITINKIDPKIGYGDFTLTIGYTGEGSLFVEAPPATLYLAPDETTSSHARFGNYESEQPEAFEVLCYTEVKMIIFPAPDTTTDWWDPAYWLPIGDDTTEEQLVDDLKPKLFAGGALREADIVSIHVGVNEAAQSWLFVPSYEVTLYLDYDYYHALHQDDIITIPNLDNLFTEDKPSGKYQYTYEGLSTEIFAEPTNKVIDVYSDDPADRTITIKPKANTDGIILKTLEDDLLDAKRAFEMSIQFSYIYNPFDGEYLNLVLDRNANTVSIVFDQVEEGYYPKFYGHLGNNNPNLDRLYCLPDDHEIVMEYDSATSNMMSFRYPEDVTVSWKDRKFLYDEKINTILGVSTKYIYDDDFYMSPRPIGYDEEGEPIFDHYIDWYNQDFTDRFRDAISSSYAITSSGSKINLDFDRDMTYNPTSGDTYDFWLSYIFDYPYYKADVVKVVLCNFNSLLHDYGPGNYA